VLSRSDVAVVGAGPAGAWAAYTLARSGARVTLFDSSHPREKPCGGGVTGRALALVADALNDADVPHVVIRTARFVDSGGVDATVDLEPDPVGADQFLRQGTSLVVASRTTFDGALVDAARRAGAAIACTRVTDLAVDRDGVRLETTRGTHCAGFVIGADGANSLVRRKVVRPFPRQLLSIATGFFAHGPTSDEVVIELVANPAGYLWSFPRPDHLAIGICAQADAGITAAQLRARTAGWIDRTSIASRAALEPYSWPIPSLTASDYESLPLAGARWALVGDAAGLVDPITREGIYFALRSADLVARSLMSGRATSTYAASVGDELVRELARAARLKAGFFRPAFLDLMVDAVEHSAPVRRVVADLVAGRQAYATLKWRLIKTLEVGLAWRALTA
jgi:geranylgeranyl reductase family protein